MTALPRPDGRSARSAATRARILSATRACFRAGDFQPTVKSISRAAAAGNVTVYRHWPRMHDLYREALDEETERSLVAIVLRESAVSDQDRQRLVSALVFGGA